MKLALVVTENAIYVHHRSCKFATLTCEDAERVVALNGKCREDVNAWRAIRLPWMSADSVMVHACARNRPAWRGV